MVHVVAAHPSFLTVGLLCRAVAGASSCHVIFYGIDIWDASRITRFLTRRLSIVHPVCISSFGSGAVSPFGVASVLRPGLTRHWFETLVTARDKGGARHIPILTVLRLDDWRTKGVPELLQAAGALPAELETKTVLVIAGQGPVPGELERVVRTAAHAQIVESPTDDELATLYASSKVMALATRTRTRGELTGEGFGMVLAEAQVAGCPVVAPVHGGSHDAYVDGFTGVRPQDESVGALVDALRSVLSDAQRWEELSEAAVRWGRTTFAPDRYEAISYATFCRPSRS
jgi:glycosyltransferase involved in cell wall biosynthesis